MLQIDWAYFGMWFLTLLGGSGVTFLFFWMCGAYLWAKFNYWIDEDFIDESFETFYERFEKKQW